MGQKPLDCRTPCGCVGWNYAALTWEHTDTESHPVWVRGLEPLYRTHLQEQVTSHPVWVRGLEPLLILIFKESEKSHPVWVRGLELLGGRRLFQVVDVAPRVGAWVGTHSGDPKRRG